ncbi:hypothetical protein [Paludibacterium yongneupense]|uniref:hypothetical protein n=1 Tax=Paludibacterium yongneupense TaxID=400061 RepID=UPI0003F68493|nr:hypothetical protein [Paludibacterium yongneupense]
MTLIPAAVGLLLTVVGWRASVSMMGLFALAAAGMLWWIMPKRLDVARGAVKAGRAAASQGSRCGMRALLLTGMLDSAVRMGFLTFLPFLLKSKGAGTAGIGLSLSLLFAGALSASCCAAIWVRASE